MPLIGFDAQATQGPQSGLGVCTTHLLSALKERLDPSLELRVYQKELSVGQGFTTLQRLLWENWTLPGRVRRDKIDLLHIPAFAPAFYGCCAHLVVTVHDIAGMLFPNQIGKASAFYWGWWLPHVIRRADWILVDSLYTRRDLIEHLRIPETRISVVYPSGHEAFATNIPAAKIESVKNKYGIRDHYFLFVGTLEPRKNLPRVLDAFKVFLEKHQDHQLVLVGSQAFAHGKYVEQLTRDHGLASTSVLAPGFLDHDSLNALYCGSQGLVFPSLYEGFGIPILEAMASGCPVITSNATSTPEVAGDAGILVDPYSIEEITDSINQLAENPSLRRKLVDRGFVQIKKFSWKATADGVIEAYKKLLN
jgi:glycosyltransferase involved in cell wall biosynthesis